MLQARLCFRGWKQGPFPVVSGHDFDRPNCWLEPLETPMTLSILLAFKCRMLRKCRDWHDLLNFGDFPHLNFNLPIVTSFPLVKSCLVFLFGLNFRMKHEDSMKTSLRPSILPPASRLVNWLLLMALMRPMQAVQPARDCYSSTSGHLEPKVGWTTNTCHVFF